MWKRRRERGSSYQELTQYYCGNSVAIDSGRDSVWRPGWLTSLSQTEGRQMARAPDWLSLWVALLLCSHYSLRGYNLPVTSKTTIAHCASDLDNYRLAGTLIRLWSLHLPVSPRPTICSLLLDQLALGTASPDLPSLRLQKTQQRSRSFDFTNTQLAIRPALHFSWADCLALPFSHRRPIRTSCLSDIQNGSYSSPSKGWFVYLSPPPPPFWPLLANLFVLRFRNFKSWRLRVCVVSVTFRWMSTIFSRG